MPDYICWPVWRIFAEKGISPEVIDRTWTLKQVLDANDVLDMSDELEAMGSFE